MDNLPPDNNSLPHQSERSGTFKKVNGTRKFILAAFGSVLSVVLCFYSHLTGPEWVQIQAMILGLYGCANVIDKKLGGNG